jgi:hypothetical protein
MGSPALTSRGFVEADFDQVADFVDRAIKITGMSGLSCGFWAGTVVCGLSGQRGALDLDRGGSVCLHLFACVHPKSGIAGVLWQQMGF